MIDPAFAVTNKPRDARLARKQKQLPLFWRRIFKKRQKQKICIILLDSDPRRN